MNEAGSLARLSVPPTSERDALSGKRIRPASSEEGVQWGDGNVSVVLRLKHSVVDKSLQMTRGDMFMVAMLPQSNDPGKCSLQPGTIPFLNALFERAAQLRARTGATVNNTLDKSNDLLVVTPTATQSAAAVMADRWAGAFVFIADNAAQSRSGKGTTAVVRGTTDMKTMFKPVGGTRKQYTAGDRLFVVAKEVEVPCDVGSRNTPTKYIQVRCYCVSPSDGGQLFSKSTPRGQPPADHDTTYVEHNVPISRPVYRRPVWSVNPVTQTRRLRYEEVERPPVADAVPMQYSRLCRAYVNEIGVVNRGAPIPIVTQIENAWRNQKDMGELPIVRVELVHDIVNRVL